MKIVMSAKSQSEVAIFSDDICTLNGNITKSENLAMENNEHDSERWSNSLAESLISLSKLHLSFREYLDQYVPQYFGTEDSNGMVGMAHHFGDALLALYINALFLDDHQQEHRYVRLRATLTKSLEILSTHPSFREVTRNLPSDSRFTVVLADQTADTSLLHILVGLLTHSRDLKEDQFKSVCEELCVFLDSQTETGTTSLTTGLHISLLNGLRLEEEFQITEDLRIVPFESIRGYVDDSLLRQFSMTSSVPKPWKSMSALVKSFVWHPVFRTPGNGLRIDTDWGGRFRADGERLAELLAITHNAPIVCLITLYYCIDPVAMRLLGLRYRQTSHTLGESARSFDRMNRSVESPKSAIDEAIDLFKERSSPESKSLEPIIARLAEATRRSGRFSIDDQILDVAMTLERMYGLGSGEITYKLRTRSACFLESETTKRNQVFKQVGDFYDERSKIVHDASRRRNTRSSRETAFSNGFDIARRSLIKLIREGHPEDWNSVVIAASDTG